MKGSLLHGLYREKLELTGENLPFLVVFLGAKGSVNFQSDPSQPISG
jgi:hypothetical protein